DPDVKIKGKHTYKINYTTKGILSSYENHDELYWNVTGNNWEVSLSSATATLTTSTDAIEKILCYQGRKGSNQNCIGELISSQEARFNTVNQLLPHEGLTIIAGIKKGVFPIIKPEKPKSFFEKVIDPVHVSIFLI